MALLSDEALRGFYELWGFRLARIRDLGFVGLQCRKIRTSSCCGFQPYGTDLKPEREALIPEKHRLGCYVWGSRPEVRDHSAV